jgi:hypothetical protein
MDRQDSLVARGRSGGRLKADFTAASKADAADDITDGSVVALKDCSSSAERTRESTDAKSPV